MSILGLIFEYAGMPDIGSVFMQRYPDHLDITINCIDDDTARRVAATCLAPPPVLRVDHQWRVLETNVTWADGTRIWISGGRRAVDEQSKEAA